MFSFETILQDLITEVCSLNGKELQPNQKAGLISKYVRQWQGATIATPVTSKTAETTVAAKPKHVDAGI